MTKNKMAQRIITIIGIVLCALLGIILLCNLTIIIKGVINPDRPPSILGVTPMVVQSGSMSGNAEDHIEVGDLIFIKKTDTDSLQKGDIVSFMDGNIVVTHRIIDITTEDGKRQFITKGDANNTEDPPIGEEVVLGKYRARIAKLGDFAMFLQKPLGMAIFIGIPVCAYILYDIVRRQRHFAKESGETEKLRAELERLRAEKESKTETASERDADL